MFFFFVCFFVCFCFKLLAVFFKVKTTKKKKKLALFTSYLSFHVFIYSDLNLINSHFLYV